jgi:Acyltransferase family
MEKIHSSELGEGSRRYDNDWLTVLATLTIFLFHCARFFNYEDWHVKNNQLDESLSVFVAVVAQWIMPLFFVLSGISSYYSLTSRSGARYIRNRFQRLVIPLIFGTFVLLIPVQVWIERFSHAQFDGSFIEFYPLYFQGLYGFGGNFAWMGLHLWYLEILFAFTLFTFPFFVLLGKARGQEMISEAAAFFEKRGAILLLGIPLFLMEWLVNLQPKGVGIRDFGGWSLFSYFVVFVTGFLVAFDLRYREAMERSRYVSLTLGLLTTVFMFFFPIDLTPLGYFAKYSVTVFARSFNSWFWLVAILGFGSRYLNFDNEVLNYAREAALPFYILHQTVIVVIGLCFASWETSVMLKYLALSASAFTVITAMYELFIKRVNVIRFLFGMTVRK